MLMSGEKMKVKMRAGVSWRVQMLAVLWALRSCSMPMAQAILFGGGRTSWYLAEIMIFTFATMLNTLPITDTILIASLVGTSGYLCAMPNAKMATIGTYQAGTLSGTSLDAAIVFTAMFGTDAPTHS